MDIYLSKCQYLSIYSITVEPEGIGLWMQEYNGPLLYYEDRTVTVYTSYIYRVTAVNDYGFVTSGNSSLVTSHGGQPFEAPQLTLTTISHTEILAQWTVPGMYHLSRFLHPTTNQ